MRLPFLWIVTAFGAGITLGGAAEVQPAGWLALAALATTCGFALWRRDRLRAAWLAGILAWLGLGGAAARLEPFGLPEDHVTRLMEAGALPDDVALRWRGRLRMDPVELPWGVRFEIELEEVHIAGRAQRVSGGLRVSYFRDARHAETAPELRAGDRVEALVRARRPQSFRNPGAFDATTHFARQGVHLTASLRSLELLERVESPPPGVRHRLARARGRFLRRIDARFAASPERAAVLRAMLLGDRSFVDHERIEQFQRTSVYHVLVVSGLHVAALAVFAYWAGRRLRLPRTAVVCVTLLLVAAFVAIVEDRPPVLRAGLMAVTTLSATLLFRRVELLNTLALAALLILLAQPGTLADPSFQLSFLAAGMIGALGLPWIARSSAPYRHALLHLSDVTRDPAHRPRVAQFRLDARDAAVWIAGRVPLNAARAATVGRWAVTLPFFGAMRLWEVFLVSAAVSIGMLPVMATYFHRVTFFGVLANVPASVLAGVTVPAGFATLGLDAVWPVLAGPGVWVSERLTAGLLWFVGAFSDFGWGTWRVPEPPAWLLAAYFVVLVLLAWTCRVDDYGEERESRGKRRGRWMLVGALAGLATVVATHPFAPRLEAGHLEVTLLDVGQGDAILVALPDGRTMLVDGGGLFGSGVTGGFRTGLDVGEQVVSPYLWSRGVKRLDVVLLTHAHQDHLDGLRAVVENFAVGELWVAHDVRTPAYQSLLEAAQRRGIAVVHKRRGDFFEWGGVTGLVLWPEPAGGAAAESASNNDSLVVRLEFGAVTLLLPGDVERAVEEELVARGDPLDVDFLKVPHHGSRTSTTAAFVSAVTPQAAAISLSGNNPFGHPHAEVVRRLDTAGAQVLRTDRDGAVTFVSDGKTWRVRGFAKK